MSKCRTETLCGTNVVCRKMYCISGAEADIFINFMWSVFLSNGNNIPFIFIFRLSPTNRQVWLWHHGWPIGTTVTMWLKVCNLLCSVPDLYKNIWFYKVAFYPEHLLVEYLCWPKHGGRGVCLERDRGSFVPFIYLGLALDRGWYKVLIWHNGRVQQETTVWKQFCIYAPVHVLVISC